MGLFFPETLLCAEFSWRVPPLAVRFITATSTSLSRRRPMINLQERLRQNYRNAGWQVVGAGGRTSFRRPTFDKIIEISGTGWFYLSTKLSKKLAPARRRAVQSPCGLRSNYRKGYPIVAVVTSWSIELLARNPTISDRAEGRTNKTD